MLFSRAPRRRAVVPATGRGAEERMIRMIRMICICRLIRRTFQPPWTAHGKWVGLCLGLLSGMTVAKSEDAGLSIESPREWQVVQRQTATLGAIPVAVRLPDRHQPAGRLGRVGRHCRAERHR